jgi:hypothetical protein
MRFSVRVDGQPYSGNLLYRTSRGQTYKDVAAERYQTVVSAAVQRARPSGFNPGPYQPREGLGMIVIEYRLFLDRDADCDNVEKVLLDGVKWGLGTQMLTARKSKRVRIAPLFDDSRFLPRAMAKYTGLALPYVVLELDDGQS